jgi:hypothetical protein
MVVTCEEVWREISNYLEGDIEPGLRVAVKEHLSGCKHCTAVMNGTRNVIELYGDERMIELPVGFDQRLRHRLEASMPRSRGTSFGWMVAAAAALLVVGSFEIANSASPAATRLRSQHAQPGDHVPANLLVVVSDGRLFHVPGCKFIHHKTDERAMIASEAVREGYVPCARCMKHYLTDVALFRPQPPDALLGAMIRDNARGQTSLHSGAR